jgi:hypothetical protein
MREVTTVLDDCCDNCRYFFRPEDMTPEQVAAGGGLCRRYPPQIMKTDGGGAFLFPVMLKNNLCGEHKPLHMVQ